MRSLAQGPTASKQEPVLELREPGFRESVFFATSVDCPREFSSFFFLKGKTLQIQSKSCWYPVPDLVSTYAGIDCPGVG